MMCDSRLFAPQIDAFAGQRAVHVAPISAHDTVGDLACAVLASMPPRFALAGLSMGGIVAMEILRTAPDRVERIALMDTNPMTETEAVHALREPQIAKVEQGELIAVMRDEMKPNYLADGHSHARILDLCMSMAGDLGSNAFVRQSRALQTRPDQQETLHKAKIPALILCGEDDVLCPVQRHKQMHDLMPHSHLVIIKDAGHLPTLEQPEATNAALRRWLEEL
jgi:pimeloyl-ACP methyl ester carboxylesterase